MFKSYMLHDIVEQIIDYRGKTPKKLGGEWSITKTRYKVLSAKNIKNGKIVQPDTIRYVTKDLYYKWMQSEVSKGTILITSEAPFGELMYWDSEEKIVLSQRLFGLKIKEAYNAKYVYYYMFSDIFQNELSSRATGSTVIGLRQSELLKCNLRIPNRMYQDIISMFLTKIDKKIEINEKINKNLYKMGIAFLKEEFSAIQERKKLSKIIKFIKGKKPIDIINNKKNKYEKYLTIGCLNCQEVNYANTEAMIMCNNDLLMVMDGASSGTVYYAGQGIVGSTLARIDSIDNNYIPEFLYFVLKYYSNSIKSKNMGSAIPHTDKAFVRSLEVPLINIKYQFKYKLLLLKILSNNRENETLEQLKNTLLSKLINGEVNLDNVKI